MRKLPENDNVPMSPEEEDRQLRKIDNQLADLFRGGRGTMYQVHKYPGETHQAYRLRWKTVDRRLSTVHELTSGNAIDPNVILYTHGLCAPRDPGGMGAHAWIAYSNTTTTTPIAEFATVEGWGRDSVWSGYEAIISGLRWAYLHGFGRVLVRSSSQEAVNQIAELWSTNAPALVAQRTTITLARAAFSKLAIEHYSARDMPVVVALAKKAHTEALALMEAKR